MISLALALVASAPSFDCAKTSTNVEKMICADEQLARLDAAMAAAYDTLSKKERTQQRIWLKVRDACGTRDCLLEQYVSRMAEAFLYRAPGVRHYSSRPNNGELSILSLGDRWYVFSVVGLWPTPGGSENIADAEGSFHLDAKGAGARAPADESDCGWRLQKLPRDRWQVSTLAANREAAFSCYGVNATIDGVYSSSEWKAK